MNELQAAAYQWIDRGVAVIPLKKDSSKLPEFDALKAVGSWKIDKGHRVGTWEPYRHRLTTPEEIKYWFGNLECNLGIVLGWQGLTLLDFDQLNWFFLWRDFYSIRTYITATPRPGVHAYFWVRETVKNSSLSEIDIKAAGGYVMDIPSKRDDGQYLVIDDYPILAINAIQEIFPGVQSETAKPATQYDGGAWQMADDPFQAAGEDLITRIKRSIPINTLIPGPYRQQGAHEFGCHCPLTGNHKHGDSHPSAFFREDTQSFYCQVCSNPKMWDVINLYSHIHGIPNGQAIQELQEYL